jgi:PAS domain S-box-containing protein
MPADIARGAAQPDARGIWTAAAALIALTAAAGLWAANAVGAVLPYAAVVAAAGATVLIAARATARELGRLRRIEAQLRAAIESLPDGLAVYDADERIVFYNARYPEHLMPALRRALAVGRRFHEVLRAGLAEEPVYHPDMGPDFAEKRIAMRALDHSDHTQRLADGRWLRIRESRTPDGGRVLLTQDITEERRRADELRLLAAAVEQVGEPVEITDASHELTYVNHAFETTTGYARDEALGRQPQAVLSSGVQPPAFFDVMRETLESGRSWQGTIVNRHRDGHLIEQDTTISPMRAAGGAITHFVAVKRDVTAVRAQARALAESEARYRAVVEAQTEFILRVDVDGRWTFMNEAAERFVGLTLEEITARGLRDGDFIYDEDRAIFEAHIARITPDNPTDTVELRGRRLTDGKVHWEQWTDTGFFDADGKLLEMQCVGREIGDRKAAEAARDVSERLRRDALEAALDCYIGIDGSGAVVEFNAAAERTFGYSRTEAIGRPMAELIIPPDMREAHARGLARHIATGESRILGRRIEVDAMRADGSVFPIELVIVKGAREEGALYLAYLRDLSERKAVEKALTESEAQFRTIAETVPVGIVITDIVTARPLFINRLARSQLGLTGEDPPSLRGAWAEPTDRGKLIAEVEAKGAVTGFEADLVTPTGEHVTMLFSATRITYGGVQALLTANVNITDLRRTQAALIESQARLRAFMDFAPVAAHLRDADGRFLMLNREMEAVLGVAADPALGRTPEEIAAPLLGDSDEPHRSVVETGRRHVSEQHLDRASGPYQWMMVVRFPVLDGDGRVSAVGTFAVDITERREAEAALRASEARLNAIIAANPVALNIARLADRRLLFVNRPYVEMFGLDGVDLDSFDRDTLYDDPAQRDHIYGEIAAGREVTNFELLLRRTDGLEIPISLTSRRILFQGEPALVTSSVDLTALRAAQAEVARSRDALHQSEKLTALGALLAGVAHELNNPLSVVVGYSSMLLELDTDPAMRARVEKIHAAAERCARIVRTFLAMARARAPKRGPVALADVVIGALDLAGYGLRSADVKVAVDVPGSLPPVQGDSDQLHQVVVNLVVNAQQALLARAAPRELALSARIQAGEAVLEVADNGPGMDPEVAKRAFEPFFTTKPQGVGTGVGLSVCHGIVAAHGGRIELETAEGQGARFRVRLPLAAGPAAAAPDPAPPPMRGGRVLVVDDEPEIAALLAERLRGEGLSVTTVSSGRRALAALEAGSFDAVISDLRMPDVDGAALAAEIATRWPALARRLLLITGDALGADADRRLAARGLPIFEKPLDLDALSAALRRRLAEGDAA